MVSIRQLWVVVFLFALSACGGGGTLESGGNNNGGGGNTAPVYSLSLTLKNGQGQTTNQLSLATPLILEATLSATQNGVISERLINFSFDTPGLATFANDTGSAATNANGVATIGLAVGTLSGAGKISASFGNVTAEVVFISAGDGDTEVGVQIGSVLLIADKLQLGSADTDKIELSALVRNINNNVVSGVPVVFTTDSGELQILDSESAVNGIARATLTTRSDKNNREIRVVARAQQKTSELLVTVIGTQIDISAPQAVVLNDSALIDIFVQDSEGNGIEGAVVNIVSSLGNALSITNPVTSGASGKASVTYTAVNSGTDTLLVSALGSQRSATLNVSPDSFTFIATSENQPLVEEVELDGPPKRLLLQWLVDDLPNAAQMVSFATSRGVIAETPAELNLNKVSVVKQTDAAGQADVFVQSQFAGLATIAAQAGTGDGIVNAQKTIEFVAVTPDKIEVQAFPAQVGPGEQSTVRAILRDALNNPVKNKTVIFSLDNSAGGQLSAVTAITNSLGVATTLFTADANTGSGVIPTCETDDADCECTNDDKTDCGLKITATYVNNIGNNTVGFTRVAVGERTLFFRFGTGNIIEKPSASLYSKEFSIIVTDSSGNPVPNQQLNIAVVPISYGVGRWVKDPPDGEFKSWIAEVDTTCANEDVNWNGILDDGEDFNKDGQLTPGNLATVPQIVTADANGIAVFNVRYPQDVGAWLDVRLQVSGFAAGSENVTFRDYNLPVSSEDVTNETSPPPQNPFGLIPKGCKAID